MKIKVISGGQTGADLAGVEAARSLQLQTGGTMPRGFKTLRGNQPGYSEMYGMVETESDKYPPRTFVNVKSADATFRFYTKPHTPGEQLTLRAIKYYKKPFLDFDLNDPGLIKIAQAQQWLRERRIKVLNVAGNSEQSSPGIYKATFVIMVRILETL